MKVVVIFENGLQVFFSVASWHKGKPQPLYNTILESKAKAVLGKNNCAASKQKSIDFADDHEYGSFFCTCIIYTCLFGYNTFGVHL